MSLDTAVTTVLSRFQLPGPWRIEPLGGAGGFSGARLWRVESPAGTHCLKSWPADRMDASRLKSIHAWMTAARATNFDFVPRVWTNSLDVSCIEMQGRLWDLVQWMSGQAASPCAWGPSRIEAACRALAELHRVWERCDRDTAIPVSILRRVEAAQDWLGRHRRSWQPTWSRCAIPEALPHLHSLWHGVCRLAPSLLAMLAPWSEKPQPVIPCLCDIWHAHVLFDGDCVTGIIDYGSMRLDTPAADLARLLGSVAGNDEGRWRVGLDAYRNVRPLSMDEGSLARMLDVTGTVVSAGAWIDWLAGNPRPFDNREAVVTRLQELAQRLVNLRI